MTEEQLLNDIERREEWPTYSNRAADYGGPTKGGITLNTLSRYLRRPATIEELQELPRYLARSIYRTLFIQQWDWVTDTPLRVLLVDYAVTSGQDDPTLALQRATGQTQDGVLGPKTREATLAAIESDSVTLYKKVYKHRQDKFLDLALKEESVRVFIAAHPKTQLRNLRGWLNRLFEFIP